MERIETRRKHRYFLFELTRKCQNNCAFCYNVWKEDRHYPKTELNAEQAVAVVDKLITESGCELIGLSGGEPLMKKGFFDIASRISERNVTPILISNGKLLTRNTVEKSMECGIMDFEVSLHSHHEDTHDKLVGRRGSFQEAIDAILNVKQLGGDVSTVFVATRENVDDFPGYVELNAMLKVGWILFNRVACGGTSLRNWESLVPTPTQLSQALDQGARLAERYKIGLGAGVQIQPCLIDLSRYPNVRSSFCPLNDPDSDRSYFAIDPAGNLRMCNRSKIILGNILEQPFDDIVSHSAIDYIGRAVPDMCRDCDLASSCAGGCKADALSCHGTLARPDPYLEIWKEEAGDSALEREGGPAL